MPFKLIFHERDTPAFDSMGNQDARFAGHRRRREIVLKRMDIWPSTSTVSQPKARHLSANGSRFSTSLLFQSFGSY